MDHSNARMARSTINYQRTPVRDCVVLLLESLCFVTQPFPSYSEMTTEQYSRIQEHFSARDKDNSCVMCLPSVHVRAYAYCLRCSIPVSPPLSLSSHSISNCICHSEHIMCSSMYFVYIRGAASKRAEATYCVVVSTNALYNNNNAQDPAGTQWTAQYPSLMMLKRIVTFAKHALEVLNNSVSLEAILAEVASSVVSSLSLALAVFLLHELVQHGYFIE